MSRESISPDNDTQAGAQQHKQPLPVMLPEQLFEWADIKSLYQEIKIKHGLTDAYFETIFGYKAGKHPGNTFRNSKRYKKIVYGIVVLYTEFKEK